MENTIVLDEKTYTYQFIFEKHFELKMIGNYAFFNDPLNNYFLLFYSDIEYYFFTNPIKFHFNNCIYKDIYCYSQILEILKKNEKNEKNEIILAFIKNKDKFIKLNPNNLIDLIKDGQEEFYITKDNNLYHSYQAEGNPFTIKNTKSFNPLDLSAYFFEYFKYNNKNDKFTFIDSPERNLLLNYLNEIFINNDIFIFKFTGPSSNGKSTTLLYFSRNTYNILYFNLSYLTKKEKENDFVSCYNAIMEEINRICFSDQTIIDDFKKVLTSLIGNSPWEIISKIFEFLKNKPYRYIFIFDQFKSKNVDAIIYNELLKKIQSVGTKIKFILCSSANDEEIKRQYFETIKEYKGNPPYLNSSTQKYYFYFNKLYKINEIKQDKYYSLYKLFDFKQKYKKLFLDSKDNDVSLKEELNKIDTRIEEKLKEYSNSCNIINGGVLNIYEAFVALIEVLDQNLDYSDLNLYYDITPIKYFYLEFNKNYFRIHYIFEYIIIFIKSKFSSIDTNNFFKKINMKENSLFSVNLKGYYFEQSAINSIKKKKIVFEKDYEDIIKINEIVLMDYIVEDKINNAIKRITMNNDTPITIEETDPDLNDKKIENKNINENINLNKTSSLTADDYPNQTNNENKNDKKDTIEDKNGGNKTNKKLFKIKTEAIKDKEKKEKKKDEEKENYKTFLKNRLEKISEENMKLFQSQNKYSNTIVYSEQNSNLLDIFYFKENINNYKSFDNKQRVLNNIYKNKSILIEQDKTNGACIDMALIWNKDNKNIFIGFQMKCFREETRGGNAAKISKLSIKNAYLDILKNSNDLLGIDIQEWHYIMVIYYNPNNKNHNSGICSYLVKKCLINGIKFIFYCPEDNYFYDSKKNKIMSKFTLLDDKSNLDYVENFILFENTFDNPKYDFLNKKHLSKKQQIEEAINEYDYFLSILSKIKNDKNKAYDFNDFRSLMKKIVDEKDTNTIKFNHRETIKGMESFVPKIGCFFCFKGKNNDLLIIIRKNEDTNLEYFNLINENNKYNSLIAFSRDIDEQEKYFFIFNF